MLPPEEAAVLTSVGTRTLYRWVEAGRIHFAEVPDGAQQRLLVCPVSAANLAEDELADHTLQT